jgi:hypothetical protein
MQMLTAGPERDLLILDVDAEPTQSRLTKLDQAQHHLLAQ